MHSHSLVATGGGKALGYAPPGESVPMMLLSGKGRPDPLAMTPIKIQSVRMGHR